MPVIITRYPHTAKIIVTTESDSADGIPDTTPTEIDLKGRFEPASQVKNIDYSAKFYCKSIDVDAFQVDGQQFVYKGKYFKITQLFNYQTHCEIWLE